jgi:hypothetical protein
VGLIDDDQFDEQECLALLGRTQLGRVAVSLAAVPVVFPVRYALEDRSVIMAVTIEELAKALDGAIAALQADGYDEDSGRRWTALAIGPTQRLAPDSIPVRPPASGGEWAGREMVHLLPQILTGRWVDDL